MVKIATFRTILRSWLADNGDVATGLSRLFVLAGSCTLFPALGFISCLQSFVVSYSVGNRALVHLAW